MAVIIKNVSNSGRWLEYNRRCGKWVQLLNEDNNNKISIMTNRIEIKSKGYFSSIS